MTAAERYAASKLDIQASELEHMSESLGKPHTLCPILEKLAANARQAAAALRSTPSTKPEIHA